MTLLEFFFIISGVIILIIAFDIARKQRFNALHFLVFIWVWWGLLTFTFFPWILNTIASVFWVARWADVLVYAAVIFLLYFVLLLLTKHVENKDSITSLVREQSLNNLSKKELKTKSILLIRAFNEAEVIGEVIDKVLLSNYKNILIVNDGSSDHTKNILDSYWDKIISIHHLMNRWAWAALETGFEYIRRYIDCEYIITFDADGQHDISDVDKLVDMLDNKSDLWAVFWSRFLEWANTNISKTRKITLFLWRLFTVIISQVNLTDPHNWLRAFRLNTIKKIKLSIDNMAYASELIDELNKNNIKIGEVPVNIKYTKYSISKWQKSSNAINIALRIIWSKFFR